jgi:flagellar hook-associated protein 2
MVATISGAVSGLDTATLINSLVSIQQNQQTLLQQQQATVQQRSDAYAALTTSLTALATQAATLANTSAWTGATATSTSTNVIATATGVKAASLTFNVTAVAAAHTLISSDSLTSTGAQAASGALTLTRSDGTTASIDVGSGSLADVVDGINTSGTGLTAAAVQTGAGAYRLQVSASGTGAASSFTLDGVDGFGSMDVLTSGADATLHLGGDSSAAYDVTSATNTFSSLVPGLSFSVGKLEDNVTVSSAVDGTAIATQVNTLVTTANSILASITSKSAWNAATKTGGPLSGDNATRALQQKILSAVGTASAPGVQLTRDGTLTFDQTKFVAAFKADPAKVAKAFGVSSSFTAATGVNSTTVAVSSALKSASAGSYDVQVDTLPERESWKIDPAGADLSGKTFELSRESSTVSYTVAAGETLAQTAAAFNSVAAGSHFGVTAKVVGSALQFTADQTGSAQAFTATLGGVAGTQVSVGTDITGTIDGQDATGIGSSLSLPTGTGGAVGLSLNISTTAADLAATGGAIGQINYTPGLAQQLVALVNDATDSQTGALTTAKTGATAEIKRFQQDIDNWDTRLTAYRATLTTQFTAMETAMAALKTQLSAISSLLTSSSTTSSSSSSLSTG